MACRIPFALHLHACLQCKWMETRVLSLSLNLTLNLPKKKSEREEENYVGRKSLLGDMVSS